MLKMIKYLLLIAVIFSISFMSYGLGRVSKKEQIYNKCMEYHAGLTKEDAKFTCENIMAGQRHAFIERHD